MCNMKQSKEVIPTHCTIHSSHHYHPPELATYLPTAFEIIFSFLPSFSFSEKPVLLVVNSYTPLMVRREELQEKGNGHVACSMGE